MSFRKILSVSLLVPALVACNSSSGGNFDPSGEPFDPLSSLTPLGGFTPQKYVVFPDECENPGDANCLEQISGGLLPVLVDGLAAIPGLGDLLGVLGAGDLYSVENIRFAGDVEPNTYATLNLPANLLGDPTGFSSQFTSAGGLGDALVISGGLKGNFAGAQGGGDVIAFDVALPADTVGVTVLQNLSVRTYLDGNIVEQFEALAPLDLALLGQNLSGAIGDERFLVGCKTSQAYDSVELSVDGVVNADLIDNILADTSIPSGSPLAAVAGNVLNIYGIVQGATPAEGEEASDYDCAAAIGAE